MWPVLCFLFFGFVAAPTFFLPAPLFIGSHVSMNQFVAGYCKRFGLYLGMRDVLHSWSSCCPCHLTCRGSIFFPPRAFLEISLSRCYQLVESCCELIGLHLGMREVLHLFGLSCACLGACRSSIVSPRVICFWISFLAAIKFLQIVVSDLVCIWVCVAC